MPGQGSKTTNQWMAEVEGWATDLGQKLEDSSTKLDSAPGKLVQFVLHATQMAGHLLAATERVLLETHKDPPPASSHAAHGPSGVTETPVKPDATVKPDPTVVLTAYTCVLTARDHLDAAEGTLQKPRRSIAWSETSGLIGALVIVLTVYTAFHPTWGWLSLVLGDWWRLPAVAASIWEVICWSFFGAVASSYLRVSQDTEEDTFDARDPFKYVYRIVTAPLVAIVLVFFWTITGFALSTGGSSVPLFGGSSTLSTLTLIVVAFLLGFFSREAQDLLSSVWKRVASAGKGTTGTSSK